MEGSNGLSWPSLRQEILRISIRYLTVTAGFFLIFRSGQYIKIFDLLIIILGIIVISDKKTRAILKETWPKIFPYFKYFIFILTLIILAQTISYIQGKNTVLDSNLITNYGRIIFNIYTLFLIAFAIYCDKKILLPISFSIFLSSFVNLPAFWKIENGGYLSGGRLTGSLQTPLILGLWMMIVFLIGIGLFMITKKPWMKISLAILLIIVASFSLWSASRAAWLALAFASTIWALCYFYKKRWKNLLIFSSITIASFLLGYLILPHKQLHIKSYIRDRATNLTYSVVTLKPQKVQAQSQTRIWPEVAIFIFQNPIGSGLGSYAPDQLEQKNRTSVSNNSFLELGLYGGVGAILIFLTFLFQIGKQSIALIKTYASDFSEINLAWVLGGLAVIVDIFFTDAFLWRHVWFVLGAVLGVILSNQKSLIILPTLNPLKLAKDPDTTR